jgi:hypothetical protein
MSPQSTVHMFSMQLLFRSSSVRNRLRAFGGVQVTKLLGILCFGAVDRHSSGGYFQLEAPGSTLELKILLMVSD